MALPSAPGQGRAAYYEELVVDMWQMLIVERVESIIFEFRVCYEGWEALKGVIEVYLGWFECL